MSAKFTGYVIAYCLLSLLLSPTVSIRAQHVLSQLEIEGGADALGWENMLQDKNGNVYFGFERNTYLPGVIGDTIIYGSRQDTPSVSLSLSDFFLVKLNSDHKFETAFVIDNAELDRDFYSSGDHNFISMTLYKSERDDSLYPIVLGGTMQLSREGNRGKGVVVVLNEDLELENVVWPTTGELGQIAADGDFLYMELRIPDYESYILVGQDTVYNHERSTGPMYGRQTVVLCKYNYVSENVEWIYRIGNAGHEELIDMEIDPWHNLVIAGFTSSSYFSFDGESEIRNYSATKPFVGKYSPNGEFIWGILNTDQPGGELLANMRLDKDGSIYLLQRYWTPEYSIQDTVLYNTIVGSFYCYRSFVVKYNSDGEFKWIAQLEGDFEESQLYDIAFTNDGQAIVGGLYFFGELSMGGITYQDMQGDAHGFLWSIDINNGSYRGHVMTEGTKLRRFYNLYVDNASTLNIYMVFVGSEEVFDHYFSTYDGSISAFLIRLTTDFTSVVSEYVTLSELSLYPNPVSTGETLYVKGGLPWSNGHPIVITDITGRCVASGEFDFYLDECEINIAGLLPGVYILQLQSSGNKTSAKFIIH